MPQLGPGFQQQPQQQPAPLNLQAAAQQPMAGASQQQQSSGASPSTSGVPAPFYGNVQPETAATINPAPGTQGQPAQPGKMMIHPQLGKVKGPPEDLGEDKEEVPYPVYIRPYDDDLPQVTWKKNPREPFGTLTIVKGEDKMIVKVPIKDDRILPRTNYPVELGTVLLFIIIAVVMWRVL